MSSLSLATIQNNLNFYIPIFLMIVGNIGNVFIIIIFGRQPQNSCIIYLISAAVVNNLFLILNAFSRIFPYDYNNETVQAIVVCKLFSYLLTVLGEVAQTFLVLACIDRFMITSESVNLRTLSTPKRAKWCIFFSFIFWLIFVIHMPILLIPMYGQCRSSGIYATIFNGYSVLFIGFIPSIISAVFGYLTYRNMKRRHTRIQLTIQIMTDGSNSIQKRDQQLLILAISDAFAYVATRTLFPIILLETMISEYRMPNRSMQYIQTEFFIVNIALLIMSTNNAAPFYIYIISSKSFRHDFKQLIMKICQKFKI